MAGGPSHLKVAEMEQQLAALTKTVERRMAGVRKGMEALNGRLGAVETAMAKLPDHLTKFRDKLKALSLIHI